MLETPGKIQENKQESETTQRGGSRKATKTKKNRQETSQEIHTKKERSRKAERKDCDTVAVAIIAG